MRGPRTLAPAERAELVGAGWEPDREGDRETGWWWPPGPYSGPAFSGCEALRAEARAKLKHSRAVRR